MSLFPLITRQCLGMEERYPQGAWSQLSLAQFYLGGQGRGAGLRV